MLSTTLQDGLNDYAIGEKLRTLRLKKKMGLVELGKHTGLSPALLSKIERGRLFPTLPTLLRIALVFGVGLEFFFAGARDKPLVAVVRKGNRVQLPTSNIGGHGHCRACSLATTYCCSFRYSEITADSGSSQPSSSSTGTFPAGFFSYSHAGRSRRSISTGSYATPFSASTIRTRAQ